MRLFVLLLALFSLASAADTAANLTLTAGRACPGSIMWMNAAADGQPAPGVELRVVLYEPYQGLVALLRTTGNGSASVGLTMNGTYRVYINTRAYEHDEYAEFPFTLCPPPPQKSLALSVTSDCDLGVVLISVTSGGVPVDGVLVRTQNWSSITGYAGNASFPFGGGDVFVTAEKAGYVTGAVLETVDCNPPQCRTPDDCAADADCIGGTCMGVTGVCGYAQNHSWVRYACCSDSDCGNGSLRCMNRTCEPVPPTLNVTKNESAPPASAENPAGCPGAAFLLLPLFLKMSRWAPF